MIVKVETAQEMALIREGKTSTAIINDKARRTRPGQDLKFWLGDPRTKRKSDGAICFGTGIISEVTDFEIKHNIQAQQKHGELYIAGFKLGYDESYQVARKAGYSSLQEMFKHYDFEYSGRLITWVSVQAIKMDK